MKQSTGPQALHLDVCTDDLSFKGTISCQSNSPLAINASEPKLYCEDFHVLEPSLPQYQRSHHLVWLFIMTRDTYVHVCCHSHPTSLAGNLTSAEMLQMEGHSKSTKSELPGMATSLNRTSHPTVITDPRPLHNTTQRPPTRSCLFESTFQSSYEGIIQQWVPN